MGNTFSEQTFDINYHSTIDIAKKAKNNGIKNFIFASSCSVYGATDGKRNEVSPLTLTKDSLNQKYYRKNILQLSYLIIILLLLV